MKDFLKKKLVLGTAQFGLDYGVANRKGKPDFETVTSIVQKAYQEGIVNFDTAQAYGDSEKVLGRVFSLLKISEKVNVISKLHPGLDYKSWGNVLEAVKQSLSRLTVSRLSGLMIHEEKLLDQWETGIGKLMKECVASGLVLKIGISLYSVEYAIRALRTESIDFIQIPTNILDRQFIDNSVFSLAKKLKKRVYVRSVFLQGLLLMQPDDIPNKLAIAKKYIEELHRISRKNDISLQELLLAYVKKETNADLVIGVDSVNHLHEILNIIDYEIDPFIIEEVKSQIPIIDDSICNPSLWNLENN